jgi:hypothetical protein
MREVGKISVGQRFERYVVISKAEKKHAQSYYNVQCDCGSIRCTARSALLNGTAKSCGCLRAEQQKLSKRTHGMSYSRLYRIWKGMIARCSKESCKEFKWYGARGISYDKRWGKFSGFYDDMGDCPLDFQLDRIDGNKNYCKENCRFVDATTQARNRSNSRVHTFFGEKLTVTEAIEKYSSSMYCAPSAVVYKRLAKNWDPVKALTEVKKSRRTHDNRWDLI